MADDHARARFLTVFGNALSNHTVTVQPRIGCAPNTSGTPLQPQCPPKVANCTTVPGSDIEVGQRRQRNGNYSQMECPAGESHNARAFTAELRTRHEECDGAE